jgi:polysaccharide deacetylase 2 family uncharacterized protein YibQ
MFAKRQSALAASAGRPPERRSIKPALAPVLAFLKRPPVAVAASAVLLFGAVALFVSVLGDPSAGAPSARIGLKREARVETAPTGMEAFTAGIGGAYQDLAAGPDALAGEATITLPDGATVSGAGAAITAPRLTPAAPLVQAPLAGLTEPGPNGALPVIASDGRVPAQAYARPFRGDGRPRVALIVGGLGLNAVTTRAAIERLPPEITLSFVPYAEGLQGWIDLARAHGHEVMIEIPMEPTGYPDNDPGPYTLLASGGAADVEAKLPWLLSRVTGYFGVMNYLGDRFVTSDAGFSAFMSELRRRGVAFVDDGVARRRPGAWARATADHVVDEVQTPAAILGRLNAVEALAKQRGGALGAGFGYPVTVEAAARWAAGLDARGLQLAPASAMTRAG